MSIIKKKKILPGRKLLMPWARMKARNCFVGGGGGGKGKLSV